MTAAALPHMKERGGRSEPWSNSQGSFFHGAGDGATAVGPLVSLRQGSFLFGLPSTSSSKTHSPRCPGSSVAGLRTCSCTAALPAARAWPLIAHHVAAEFHTAPLCSRKPLTPRRATAKCSSPVPPIRQAWP